MNPPQTQRVLVVVQDVAERSFLEQELGKNALVESAPDALSGLELVERSAPDVIVVDNQLAVSHETQFLDRVRERAPHAVLITIHDGPTVDSLVESLARGAHRTLTRPVRPDALRLIIQRSGETAAVARAGLAGLEAVERLVHPAQLGGIVGSHPSMQRLYERLESAAQSRATVLIHGETGTGKELVAAAVHRHSKRQNGPFVRLNCAALAESVLESELFGHEKGAFTGAQVRRRGRFEQADGGTLFLDELSEMPPSVQVKLLRFLQEREFERVGGNETIKVDTRVIAATNRDLGLLVSEGKFREDLYYRLRVVVLEVPPLRARPSDIMPLAEHFLRRYNDENEKSVIGFSDRARQGMLDYPWPGNVRELQHAVEQAVVLCQGTHIDLGDLPIDAHSQQSQALRLMIPGLTMAELERYAILRTLESVDGSTSKAASLLGISRRTIQYRLQEWGLAGHGRVTADDEDEAQKNGEHDPE